VPATLPENVGFAVSLKKFYKNKKLILRALSKLYCLPENQGAICGELAAPKGG
jgi:hypothetical protein